LIEPAVVAELAGKSWGNPVRQSLHIRVIVSCRFNTARATLVHVASSLAFAVSGKGAIPVFSSAVAASGVFV